MKLRDLRELVGDYNSERTTVRTKIKGEHKRLKPTKEFIYSLKKLDDDYELNDAQALELVLLFPEYKEDEYKEDSNLGEFLNGLKDAIGMSDSLIALVKGLKKKNLMDENLFNFIYQFHHAAMNNTLILEDPFLTDLKQNQTSKKNYVRAMLLVYQKSAKNILKATMKNCVTTLVSNRLLTDETIGAIFKSPGKCTQTFFDLVQTLASAKLLTQRNLEFLLSSNSMGDSQTHLFNLLNTPTLSKEKLISVFSVQKDHVFIKSCFNLKANGVDLSDCILDQLTKLESDKVARMSSDTLFRQSILFLMTEVKGDIFITAANKGQEFATLCANLGSQDIGFLSSDILNALVKLGPSHLDLILEITEILKTADILTQSNLVSLVTMKPRYLPNAFVILENLNAAKLLTNESLNTFLGTLHKKSDPYNLDIASTEEQEKFTIHTIPYKDKDGKVKDETVYVKKTKKNVDNGEQNHRVSDRGFISPTDNMAKYKITWFEDDVKNARKDAKYKRIYRDTPTFFKTGNRHGVMIDWDRGSSLDTMGKGLSGVAAKQRLSDFKSLLIELNVLHQQFRVIGNLTPANCHYNIVEHTISFINFEGAHKGGSMSKDMHGLISVLDCLFKDILEHDYAADEANATTQSHACLKQAILNLKETLSFEETSRPTAVMVMKFVDDIYDRFDTLTPELVTEITDQVLKNSPCEYSDIVCGRSMTM